MTTMNRLILILALVGLDTLSGCVRTTRAPGTEFRDCSDCPAMTVLPPGRFAMGSPADEPQRDADEGPMHDVNLARKVAIGRHEVTRGQYAAFARATNRADSPECLSWVGDRLVPAAGRSWRDPGIPQSDDHPVVCVSWRDASAYAAWLASKTGKAYRLPSEAEWEYAARGGTSTAFAFSGGEAGACQYANIGDRRAEAAMSVWRTADCDDGVGFGTAKVGSYLPNGYGLHDTIGNVWEWVADCYRSNYDGAPTDGTAWGNGGECGSVLDRGGGFSSLLPGNLRPANRSKSPSPDLGVYTLGFRVARDMAASE